MTPRFSVAAGLALALAASPLLAQRTFVVDQQFRPGAQFRDLPQAVAAAADGDLIVVRFGTYTAVSTSKGLMLLGEGDPLIARGGPLTVTQLPAGKQFVMKSFRLSVPARVLQCEGRVHFERVSSVAFNTGAALEVDNSEQATITGSTLLGRPALFCRKCDVAVSGSLLDGQPANELFTACYSGAPALRVEDAYVVVSGGAARGGAGLRSVNCNLPPSPAVELVSGTLLVAGDSTTTYEAGFPTTSVTSVPAIFTRGGSLTIDPAVKLGPQGGAPGITGAASVTTRRLSTITRAAGAPPGGAITAEVFSPVGDLVLFFPGTPSNRIPVGPLGDLWIDPLAIAIGLVGVQDSTEHLVFTFPVPLNSPRGAPITLQALTGVGPFFLSTPAVVVLD